MSAFFRSMLWLKFLLSNKNLVKSLLKCITMLLWLMPLLTTSTNLISKWNPSSQRRCKELFHWNRPKMSIRMKLLALKPSLTLRMVRLLLKNITILMVLPRLITMLLMASPLSRPRNGVLTSSRWLQLSCKAGKTPRWRKTLKASLWTPQCRRTRTAPWLPPKWLSNQTKDYKSIS